jgi:hypothetical protein
MELKLYNTIFVSLEKGKLSIFGSVFLEPFYHGSPTISFYIHAKSMSIISLFGFFFSNLTHLERNEQEKQSLNYLKLT